MTSGSITIIGFGEAARAFADGMTAEVRAFDAKCGATVAALDMAAEARRLGVRLTLSNAEAVTDAAAILSLVTAGQASIAAEQTSRSIAAGALYLDMNSVAPGTKRAAAAVIEAAGGRYIDVAVMAPAHPARRGVPLLVGGPHADAGAAVLRRLGFADVRIAGGEIGAVSAIKMIRSVMIKGIEALTAECLLAAERGGVRAPVLASLDASWPDADWARRCDYNLDRMLVHGVRRADEMGEVVKTIEALGLTAPMARATMQLQHEIGIAGLGSPAGLDAKLAALMPIIPSRHSEQTP